jgi:putative DNA methylase
VVNAGIIASRGGKVQLLSLGELDPDWDPETDGNRTAWEVLHYMIKRLSKGEESAAEILAAVGSQGEVARDLAYRLYSICEKKGWAKEAVGYNSIIASWPEIAKLSASVERKERPGEFDFA